MQAGSMHAARKDRFVACKPYVTEELRVNGGVVRRLRASYQESLCSRLGRGAFEDE
jgi:hypothetical protein